jgi:O-antigen/teichoic acid export membrane protein
MMADLTAFTWINTAGSATLVICGFLWIPAHGAAGAGAAWLMTHVVSQSLACVVLKQRGRLGAGMAGSWLLALAGTGAIAVLAVMAAQQGGSPWRAVQVAVLAGLALMFARRAKRIGLLPTGLRGLLLARAAAGARA